MAINKHRPSRQTLLRLLATALLITIPAAAAAAATPPHSEGDPDPASQSHESPPPEGVDEDETEVSVPVAPLVDQTQALEIDSVVVVGESLGSGCPSLAGPAPLLCWNGELNVKVEYRIPVGAKPGDSYILETLPGYAFIPEAGTQSVLTSPAGVEFGKLTYAEGRFSGYRADAVITVGEAVATHHGIRGYITFPMTGNHVLDGVGGGAVIPVGIAHGGREYAADKNFTIQAPSSGTSLFTSAGISATGKPMVRIAGGITAADRRDVSRASLTVVAESATVFLCKGNSRDGVSVSIAEGQGPSRDGISQVTKVTCSEKEATVAVDGLTGKEDVVLRVSAEATAWNTDHSFVASMPGKSITYSRTLTQKTPSYDFGILGGAFEFTKTVDAVEDTNGNGIAGDSGDRVEYSFAVTNTGEIELPGVLLQDPMLGITDFQCLEKPLKVKESRQCAGRHWYTITDQDVATGEVTNVATATVLLPDGSKGPEKEATAQVPTTAAIPQIELEKVVEWLGDASKVPTVGDRLTYTFSVTNTGNTVVREVYLSDPLLFTSEQRCNDTPLAPGETQRCSVEGTYAITEEDAQAGIVRNTATARVPEGPSDTDDADQKVALVEQPPLDPPQSGPNPGPKQLAQTGAGSPIVWTIAAALGLSGAVMWGVFRSRRH